jgi:hypothetical protein
MADAAGEQFMSADDHQQLTVWLAPNSARLKAALWRMLYGDEGWNGFEVGTVPAMSFGRANHPQGIGYDCFYGWLAASEIPLSYRTAIFEAMDQISAGKFPRNRDPSLDRRLKSLSVCAEAEATAMLQAAMGVPDGTTALMRASQELTRMMRIGVPLTPELIQLITTYFSLENSLLLPHDSQNAGAPCSLATPRPCLPY